MRIICGTDFSKPAVQAANAAAAMAGSLKENLLLAHVFEGAVFSKFSPKVYDSLLATAREHLHAEAERLRALGPIVKEKMLTGLPDEALVKFGRTGSTRLIVVSSLGRSAPERWPLGSVSERTAVTANVPTLVVRDATSFQSWASGERALKIFVAFDFTISAEAALSWTKELAAIGPCDVVVGYVDWPPAELARLGSTGPLPLTKNTAIVQGVLQRDLTERVHALFGHEAVRVRIVPSWGRPDAALIELARAQQADLIVTGTHGYYGFEALWHGSVSQGLLHYAPMNVAVVPTPAQLPQGTGTMPHFRRVLIATDFSALGDHAIPYAYAALAIGGLAKLIHVIPPGKPSKRENKQKRGSLLQNLRSLIPIQAEARGISTEVEVIEHREPAKAICQEAERFGADLICMGSHGRSGFSKAVLGSVAQEVMTSSPRPLLVVRPPIA